MPQNFPSSRYPETLQTIVENIRIARYNMLKTVSKQTVELYWDIGKTISEKIEIEGWGNGTVEKLAKDLQTEFEGIKGFSVRNLRYMKSFYQEYCKNAKLQPLVAEIGWVQNCIIVEKCKNDLEREFYLRKTKENGWSKLDLVDKISQNLFQNQLLSQNNFQNTFSEDLKSRVAWEFVDDYNVELINPDQPIAEKELENNIVVNIIKFLSEMGGNFAFVGRQFKLEYRDKEYFIDLMFFNLTLNCYVVFELKAREFNAKDLGQLQMYLLATNETIKTPEHNSTIGVLICKEKDRTVVEYLLQNQNQPLGVATYNQYKNFNELPINISQYLPNEEEIVKRLTAINQ
jgi:predicted nuclease of restriction endonuclease-like (RecB) superfamily